MSKIKDIRTKVYQWNGLFTKKTEFKLAISPEGTRKKVQKWKTGFYYIAMKSNVPIICISLNFLNKTVTFSKPFNISGNIKKDIPILKINFKKSIGKIAKYS